MQEVNILNDTLKNTLITWYTYFNIYKFIITIIILNTFCALIIILQTSSSMACQVRMSLATRPIGNQCANFSSCSIRNIAEVFNVYSHPDTYQQSPHVYQYIYIYIYIYIWRERERGRERDIGDVAIGSKQMCSDTGSICLFTENCASLNSLNHCHNKASGQRFAGSGPIGMSWELLLLLSVAKQWGTVIPPTNIRYCPCVSDITPFTLESRIPSGKIVSDPSSASKTLSDTDSYQPQPY